MTDESLQDNPFAAPSELVHAALTEATDDWYEVRGETVVCRKSLQLPMYCLVTGAACPGAAPLDFQLVHAPRFIPAEAWFVSCFVVGGILSLRGAPTAVSICFYIAGVGIPVAAGILSSRSSSVQRLPVTAFLSPGRRRTRNLIPWLSVASTVPLVLDSLGVLPRGLGGFWFAPYVVFYLISIIQRTWLRGVRLKMRPLDGGLHEITGFSAAFLARLKEHSEATGKAAQ